MDRTINLEFSLYMVELEAIWLHAFALNKCHGSLGFYESNHPIFAQFVASVQQELVRAKIPD